MLLGLCILGIVLGNLQNSSKGLHHVDRVGGVVRAVIEPLALPLSRTTRAIGDFLIGIGSARHLAEENRRLKELEAPLAMYSETLDLKDQEIARLRALQGFGEITGKKRVPASVSGYSINENRLTLNVGSRQGITLGAPVECASGLVGTVEEIEPNECQVLMLTSAGLQMTSRGKTQLIGALDVFRKPPLLGLLRGENATTLSMTFSDPKAPAQVGDLVVTSGYSEKIPAGITIGKIIQIEPNEEFGELKARIDPAFSPANLLEVFVLI